MSDPTWASVIDRARDAIKAAGPGELTLVRQLSRPGD
jgi:hypothetical protein